MAFLDDSENNRVVADKTFGEIKTAADSGKFVIIKTAIEGFVDSVSSLASCSLSGSTYVICFAGGDGNIETMSGSQNDYPTKDLQ